MVKSRLTLLSILYSVGTTGVFQLATDSVRGRLPTRISALIRPETTASRSLLTFVQRASPVTGRPMLSRTRNTSSASGDSLASVGCRE